MDWIGQAFFFWFLFLGCLFLWTHGQTCRDVAMVKSVVSRTHWKHDDVELLYGNSSDYRLVKRLGVGSFGEAYYAFNAKEHYPCVIKIYRDKMTYSKMVKEMLVMQSLCGGPNIIKLYDLVKEGEEGLPAIVIEYVNFTDHRTLYPTFTPRDVKYYMRELLKAVEYMHRHEVLHRDIKPHNVLIDHQKRQLRLIDFGISRFHATGTNHSDAGTLNFLAPEVLLGQRRYNLKADMWAVGVMFAGIIFQKPYFFKGHDYDSQLTEITKVLGMEGLKKLAGDIGASFDTNSSYAKERHEVDLNKLVTPQNKHLATPDAIYALSKLLRYEPDRRYSAMDMLKVPYFF